jgi:hypothetical protein
MGGSRSLMHLTAAFGASCGAWLGLNEPSLGVGWGMIYGVVFGAVIGKMIAR